MRLFAALLVSAFLSPGLTAQSTATSPSDAIGEDQIPSEVCMNCHDGTTAIAVRPGSSHPWGIDYDRVQPSSRKFLKASSLPSGFGSTIAKDLLVNGKVECVSCHFPHERETNQRFRLRRADHFAQLCRGCHDPR